MTEFKGQNYAQELILDQEESKMTILSVSFTGNTIYVTLANNGTIPLWEFNHFAVIVEYYANVSNSKELIISSYNYTSSSTLLAYQWTSNNAIINPDSSDVLKIALPYPPYPNTQAVIVISNNYGYSTTWRGLL